MIPISLKVFFSKIRNYKKNFIILNISLLGVALTFLALGYAIKGIVDNSNLIPDKVSLDFHFIQLFILVFLLAIFIFLRSKNIAIIANNIELDIKKSIFKRLINYDSEFFTAHSAASLHSKIDNDIRNIKESIAIFFSFFVRNSILIVGGIILLFYNSWILSLLLLISLPFIILPSIFLIKQLKAITKKIAKKTEDLYITCNEVLEAINIVQAYNSQEICIDKINKKIDHYRIFQKKQIIIRSLIVSGLIFLVSTALVIIIWLGLNEIREGGITAGELASFTYYAIIVAAALGGMSEVFADLTKANLSAHDLNNIMEYKSIENKELPVKQAKPKNYLIEFDSVSFQRENKRILNDINFHIKEGEKIALIGPSGSGKTTIFNLILGLLVPSNGSIYWKNKKINKDLYNELRQAFSYIPQEPKLFTGTIRENITFGKPDIEESSIIETLKKVNLYDEIVSTSPKGIDSFIGISGKKLSVGQKQRLSLARGILRNPQVLLLDEATSNLDNRNETSIFNTIMNLMADKTIFVITHKLERMEFFDKVLVLNEGRLINCDTHINLINQKGLYYQLYSKQFE